MALSQFDIVVTTPQYGLPDVDNVIHLPLPFGMPKQVADVDLADWKAEWRDLPRPWTIAVIGGAKFPIKLGPRELEEFGAALNRFAGKHGGSVVLMDSPRTNTGAIETVAKQIKVPIWKLERGKHTNPYHAALALGDMFTVTSDSVSMVSEMLSTRKPVSIFCLPSATFRPRWHATSGPMKYLAQCGLLMPPRDVSGFMCDLIKHGTVGDVTNGVLAKNQVREGEMESRALQRIRQL